MNTLYLSFALPITLQLSRTLPLSLSFFCPPPFSITLSISHLLCPSLSPSPSLSLLIPLSCQPRGRQKEPRRLIA